MSIVDERKLFNLKMIQEKNYDAILPITAELVTTLNCPFRCVQCSCKTAKTQKKSWEKNNFSNEDLHMQESTLKIVLERLKEAKVANILFTGGGEPLINLLTLNGMRLAKKNGSTVALYTNGLLLNSEKTEDILDIEPLFIRISIYGGNANSFKEYTQSERSNYNRVIQNVQYVAKRKAERKSAVIFGLSFLLHPILASKPSIDSFVDQIFKFSKQEIEQLNFIRFTPVVNYDNFTKQHSYEFMYEISTHIEEKIKPRFEGTGIEIKLYYHRLEDLYAKKTYKTCRASGWFVEVAPSGEIFLCCEKHFLPEYKIGNLLTHSLTEIWGSQLRKDIIQKKINNSHCADCPTLCKPHEINKLIETFSQTGNINKLREKIIIKDFKPGKLNDYES